jgi:HlyD family secretion protein
MNKKRIIPFVALIIVLVAMAYFRLDQAQNGPSSSIFLSGNIELRTVNLAFKVPGKLVELAVEEGDTVSEGMTLAALDPELLQRQRDQAEAGLAASQSRRRELEASLVYQISRTEAQIEQQNAEMKQAQAQLNQLLSGSRDQEIEEGRASLQRVASEAQRARLDWERAQTLYQNEDISTAQRDQFQSTSQASAASVQQARQRLDLLIEGPRKEDIEAARAQLERAQAGLKLVETQHLDVKRTEQSIETARAEVESARAQLALIDTQLGDIVMRSPIDGVVLVKAAEAGEVLAGGTTVVEIGDVEHPWLRGYISEGDLGRVQLDSPVRITTDSYPGKIYEGRISFIASEAEFTPKQIQTLEERVKLVYRIKIDVSNPDRELKLNMPSDAEIILE